MKMLLLYMWALLSFIQASQDERIAMRVEQDLSEAPGYIQNKLAAVASSIIQIPVQMGCAEIVRHQLSFLPIPLHFVHEHIMDHPWHSLVALSWLLTIFMEAVRYPTAESAKQLQFKVLAVELFTLLAVILTWQLPEMAYPISGLSIGIIALNLYRVAHED